MNDLFSNNSLFFALSVFSLIFHDLSKDYQTFDYYYPKRFDIKSNKIRQIEIIDKLKNGNSLYDYAIFKFSKYGELEYCGTDERKPVMHTISGYFDTEHLYDSAGILVGDKLNPKINGDKYFQKYNVKYTENPRTIEFNYREDLFFPIDDTTHWSQKPDKYSHQKLYLDEQGKILKYIVRSTCSIGPVNWYDPHDEFYSYDKENLLRKIEVHSVLNNSSSHVRNYSYFITYDSNKNIVEIIGGSISKPSDTLDIEKITDWRQFTYDKNNRRLKVFEKTNITHRPMVVNEYFYDANGHLIKEIYQSSLFPDSKEFHYFNYSNDLISNRVETNSKGDTLSSFTYHYEFYQ